MQGRSTAPVICATALWLAGMSIQVDGERRVVVRLTLEKYDVEDWDETVRALETAGDVAIACHVNPDGDGLGSVLAASLGLRKLGKDTYPSWGAEPPAGPPPVPSLYTFLPALSSLVGPAEVPQTDVFLALDCGAGDRLGCLEDLAKSAGQLINVDHHRGNESFGTLNVVVPTAPSTAELVTRLLQDLGVDVDLDIATCLYTGIVTDTGRFQYANAKPQTLRLAADLLAVGVDSFAIAQHVFESAPFGYLKLAGRVLERATLIEDARLVYSWTRLDDLTETGVGRDDMDKLIDAIRATRQADVAALFKEQEDGTWRVSLRSKGPDVGVIARARGGGGHDLAAGFTGDDLDMTVAEIAQHLADGRRHRP